MTDRTSIRPFSERDTQQIYDSIQESGEHISQWLPGINAGLSVSDVRNWIASTKREWTDGTAYHFVMERDGSVAGACGLTHIDHNNCFANLYYWVRKSRVGQGIAPEAVPQVAQFGFERGLQRVEIVVATRNSASLRVAQKIGAKQEGILRNRIRINDQAHDAVMFSLIPSDLDSGTKGAT